MGDCALGPRRTDECMILPHVLKSGSNIPSGAEFCKCALEIELGESRDGIFPAENAKGRKQNHQHEVSGVSFHNGPQ